MGSALEAQGLKNWQVDVSSHVGKIIKHTPKLTFNLPSVSYGLDVNIHKQMEGRRDWQVLQGYPAFGLSFLYYNFGDRDILGNAYGLLPNLKINITRKERYHIDFFVGTGIAWLDQHFDRVENTLNNAIGSNLNNITSFRFSAYYRLQQQLSLKAGISFVHFSNGAAQLPNFGLNVPAVMLGIQYHPNTTSLPDKQVEIDRKPDKRWGLNVHMDLAFQEFISIGGPRFPIYIASVGALYSLNKVNRLGFGVEYEYKKAIFEFGLHTYDFGSEREARRRASRYMLYVSDEFLFGPVGITLQIGAYISRNSFLVDAPIYNKLSTRFYLPPWGKPKTQLYFGIYLKSHYVRAEYIALGMGATL
ncbi:MAG: acyloxyacyl hydrolase [Bacteroidota bacterium]